MKRAAFLIAFLLTAVSCASMQQQTRSHVDRAVQALGGADALGGIKTVATKGSVRQWEPEQSMAPGGEPRFACESTFEAVTDVAGRTTRADWVRSFAYPAPRTFRFSEVVTPDAGYVAGIDSNGRTKQSQESNPPAHSMSGLRLTTSQRELLRTSPVLLLEMQRNPDRLSPGGDVMVGNVSYPAVDYKVGGQTFTVMFDRTSALPVRIRTLDYDNIWGDVPFDVTLSDWQIVDGVRVATTRTYELNGQKVAEVKLTETKLNAPATADRFAIPAAFKTGAARPAAADRVPYQWVIRRQFIGTYLDSDTPSYDARGSGLRFVELSPGVQHVTGGSHHSLLVEQRDHLIVFDAPVSDGHSKWVLDTAKAKYPGKPVKYLVLTHHHMDHAGGLRAYAAQGATIVAGRGSAAHYRRVLAAPFTRNLDLASRDLRSTPIVEVTDKYVMTDGSREVHAYVIDPNPHAEGLLIGYLPETRLGFATDIWSPGAGPLPDKLNPALAALVTGVKRAGISPQRFAGGHGSVADYAPLAALEGK